MPGAGGYMPTFTHFLDVPSSCITSAMLGLTRSVLFAVAAVAVLTASPAVAAVEVTQCGASVPVGATGFLSADLDCSATSGDGVLLNNGATLMLGGFELIGNPSALSGTGVRCTGNCSVTG